MRDQFESQPCAYLGITVPNFPNFFYVLGPNTVLAHSSLIYMIECQVATRRFTQRATSTLGQLHPSDDGKDGGFKSGHYWAKVRDFEKTRPRSDRRAFQQLSLIMLNFFHKRFESSNVKNFGQTYTFIGMQGIKTYQTMFSLQIGLHLQQLRWCCPQRGCRPKTWRHWRVTATDLLWSEKTTSKTRVRKAPTDLLDV